QLGYLHVGRANLDHTGFSITDDGRPGFSAQSQGAVADQGTGVVAGGNVDHLARGRWRNGSPPVTRGAGCRKRGSEQRGEQAGGEQFHVSGSRRDTHIAAIRNRGKSARGRVPMSGQLLWMKFAIFCFPIITGVNGSMWTGALGSS